MAGGKKQSKNNPDIREVKKQSVKVVSSIECDKCSNAKECKAYIEYSEKLKRGYIGFGVKCKK